MVKLAAITSNVVKSNIVNSEAATAAAVTPVAVDHTLLCPQKPTRRRARVVQFDNPSQGVPSPLVREGLSQEIPGTLVWVNLSQEAPSPVVQVDSIQDALPPEILEDQTQMVSSPVVQVDPSQEAQGPMVQEEPTLMFQFPVVPEVYNLVEPHPKLPTSPVVSALVKESLAVCITLPEPPVNPVTPKKGSHVSRVMSSGPTLVPDSEVCPEHPNLPATAKKAISVLPTSHVMITERMLSVNLCFLRPFLPQSPMPVQSGQIPQLWQWRLTPSSPLALSRPLKLLSSSPLPMSWPQRSGSSSPVFLQWSWRPFLSSPLLSPHRPILSSQFSQLQLRPRSLQFLIQCLFLQSALQWPLPSQAQCLSLRSRRTRQSHTQCLSQKPWKVLSSLYLSLFFHLLTLTFPKNAPSLPVR